MKTIGLMGGMSWESSIEYYRLINQYVREISGGLHSAKSVMVSVDFAEMEAYQSEDRWDDAARLMIQTARQIQDGGADFLVICTNTMHKLAARVEKAVQLPLLHIADAAANAILSRELKTIALLGTKFTMEEDFYRGRLGKKHGLGILIPNEEQREVVHRIIYDELVVGMVREESRKQYVAIIDDLIKRGAQGVILGCTEIGLLIKDHDVSCPVFDTTTIHARAAVELALDDPQQEIDQVISEGY